MLQFLFRLADLDQVPTYLEAAGDKNLSVYGKMGFEVKEKGLIKYGSYEQEGAAMVRPAKSPVDAN